MYMNKLEMKGPCFQFHNSPLKFRFITHLLNKK